MPLINLEINLILTWSADYITSSVAGKTKISITDTKLYSNRNFINSRQFKTIATIKIRS